MKSILAIMLLAVTVYILPLNVRPMSIPDESRYAEIPREMIQAGDWVVPRLDGMRYFEKPVMGYWLNAVSILIFGENNFAIRFPSALSACLSALIIFLVVRKVSDERRALLTAAAFLTCALVFAIGVFSVLDSMFSVFVTGTMAAFFIATQAPEGKRRNLFLGLAGISCGLAFLTKGFLAFALPVAGIVPFLFWEKRFKESFRLAWLPALVALLVILPWAILIHIHESDYWYQFFWVEHVRRFFSPTGLAQHEEPCWFFLPILAGGLFPWILLAPAAVAGSWRNSLNNPLSRFAACWFTFTFLFLSASTGKLGTYILPCFPPLAILIADGISKYLDGGRSRLFTAGALLTAALTAGGVIFLVLCQTTGLLESMQVYNNSEAWKWIMVATGLALFSVFALLSARQQNPTRRIILYATAPTFFFFTLHFAIPQAFHLKANECMNPAGMISRHMQRIKPGSVIIAENYLVHAVCWVTKRNDIYLSESAGELSYGLTYPEANNRCIKPREFRDVMEQTNDPVTLITDVQDYVRLEPMLPKPFYVDNTNGLVCAQYRMKENQVP